MAKFNAQNERIKHAYLEWEQEARGKHTSTVDNIRDAIYLFEEHLNFKDFKNVSKQDIVNFKNALKKKKNTRTGEPISKKYLLQTSQHLIEFFQWLLSQKLSALQNTDMPNVETAATIFELSRKASELFKSRPADQKRRVVNLLVSNCSYKDGNIDVVLKPVFQELLVSSKTGNWCALSDYFRTNIIDALLIHAIQSILQWSII